jgi:hypothetical protein
MDPCTFLQSFPFIPPEVLCRFHEFLSTPKPAPVFKASLVTIDYPPGETAVQNFPVFDDGPIARRATE